MKRKNINVLLLSLYCFPFVYFSMHQDFTNGSMIGYLIMIIITSILAFIAKYTDNTHVIVIGNFLSVIISYYFINSVDVIGWDGYFKPLRPQQLLILVSLLNLIPQLIAVKLAIKLKSDNINRDI